MNKIAYILTLTILLGLAGCDSFLEVSPDGNFTEDKLWEDPTYAEGVLMNAYNAIPVFYTNFSHGFLDCATDNAVTNNYGSALVRMASGGWTAGSNPIDMWSSAYDQIRYINLFLENGLDVEYYDYDEIRNEKKQKRLKGEAYFLRAWYQWELLRRYAGPVEGGQILGFPIITNVIDVDDVPQLSRNTYQECVLQIEADCDSAINNLPEAYTGNDLELGSNHIGRATSVAARSLKSRVFLYAASPLFSDATNQMENWEEAAHKAHEVIDVIGSLPSINSDFYNDPNSPEIIMRRYTTGRSPESANYPPSFYGSGRTNPSQELVDAFPMVNGYPIDDNVNSGYDSNYPYANRDPRFYNTILYNDAEFNGDSIVITPGGKDSETVSVGKATRTGYYLRKWMSGDVNLIPGESSSDDHYFALFRKVEFYLNYAEAANEAWGPDQDPLGLGLTAEGALRAVRQRAGIFQPDNYLNNVVAQGKDAFRELIHNERNLELCFENHRFFDIRRWNVAMEVLNRDVTGIEVEMNMDGTYQYTPKFVEKRSYQDYMYYGPLPFGEIVKSENLEQNKGW